MIPFLRIANAALTVLGVVVLFIVAIAFATFGPVRRGADGRDSDRADRKPA
jgi:hypothetical protein